MKKIIEKLNSQIDWQYDEEADRFWFYHGEPIRKYSLEHAGDRNWELTCEEIGLEIPFGANGQLDAQRIVIDILAFGIFCNGAKS